MGCDSDERVDLSGLGPEGEIVAISPRGRWIGNRGCIHDGPGQIARAWRSRAWITCELSYKDWVAPKWEPGGWTALFFHDEAVALAAGHRPCALCRRPAYNAFLDAWVAALGGTRPRAIEVDARLHADRLGDGLRAPTLASDDPGSAIHARNFRAAALVATSRCSRQRARSRCSAPATCRRSRSRRPCTDGASCVVRAQGPTSALASRAIGVEDEGAPVGRPSSRDRRPARTRAAGRRRPACEDRGERLADAGDGEPRVGGDRRAVDADGNLGLALRHVARVFVAGGRGAAGAAAQPSPSSMKMHSPGQSSAAVITWRTSRSGTGAIDSDPPGSLHGSPSGPTT